MSAVLHHDLKQDIQRCCRIIMQTQGALADGDAGEPSKIDVITPFNIPPGALSGAGASMQAWGLRANTR
ncbi:hypothetical protein E5206_11205 [Arthrobacter sp. PAMC25564]|uniref:hypothetical protein n=1 Tax=Arthrobacter sp. PAMC25564 TaxID=2565366 RepID=UPI0010A236A9|nr:hypothetical protein [Arthrobacter sp. PAMC25564]QCB97414.1 hypothetical protein E5206_11205 [Arthrobacter sp. PAMC25564]